MTDCTFDPTLPECQAPEEPGMEEMPPMMVEEDAVDLLGWKPLFEKDNSSQGQMVYTNVALGNAIWAGFKLFRYRSASGFYDAGKGADGKGTNWWQIWSLVNGYGNLLIWSVVGVLNILTYFGVAVELNASAWPAAFAAFAMLNIFTLLAGKWAYEMAYAETTPNTALMNTIV